MARQAAAPAQAAQPGKVSFKLNQFVQGGGVPDGLYLISDHDVVAWDYDHKIAKNVTAVRVQLQPVKIEGKQVVADGDMMIQHYSVGDIDKFVADETGKGFRPVGTGTQLSKSSNFYMYIENMVNAGFPEDQFDNDLSVFNGTIAQLTNIPQPERNLPQSNLVAGASQPNRGPRTIPVPKVILKLPWETAVRNVAAAAPAARPAATVPAAAPAPRVNGPVTLPTAPAPAAAPAAESPSDEHMALLTDHLTPILAGAPKTQRTAARVAVFKSLNAAKVPVADRDAAIRIFNSDEALANVLAMIGGGYALNGLEIESMGG